MAPVPHLYQIGTGANFLNGTSAGANFSNGTGAKHFQTLAHSKHGTGATPLPNWHWCQFSTCHQCYSFSNLAPVPVCQMAPVLLH